MRRYASKAALAVETWRLLFGFFMHTRPQRDAVLARLGLTPSDLKGLASLDERDGHTMKTLARMWQCDASTATWLVDRLERLGAAERRTHPTDRRSKLVVLTGKGAAIRAELLEGMYATPPELLHLNRAELQTLRTLLAKLPTEPPIIAVT